MEDGSTIGVATVTLKFIFQLLDEQDWLTPFQVRSEIIDLYDLLGAAHEAIVALYSDHYSRLKIFNQFLLKTSLQAKMWTEVLQYRFNIQTNGTVALPDSLVIDMDKLRADNDFMERKEYNLMSK